jgi:MazG family protein
LLGQLIANTGPAGGAGLAAAGRDKPSYPKKFPVANSLGKRFERLVEIMARLRAPDGCPWDREQTLDSIKPYTLEETYEVMEAIDRRDYRALAEELGDYLLQAVFYARIAEEAGHFHIGDSLDAINEKLIRRHPHVFGEGDAKTPGEVKKRWDEIKADERLERGEEPKGLLDSVVRGQPALAEGMQISRKAAEAGFEWEKLEDVVAKLHEELEELKQARLQASREEMEAEVGDVLFTVINIARWLDIDAEQALRRTNAKFRERFAFVEKELRAAGRTPAESTLEEMESLWQKAKSKSVR